VHSGPFNRLISSSSLAAFGQKTVDFQYVPGTIIQMYALSHTPNIMVAARWSTRRSAPTTTTVMPMAKAFQIFIGPKTSTSNRAMLANFAVA
jgi:hypothetical protein